MTVRIYVAKDSSGKEWGPDYRHEMEGVIDLLIRLWKAYHPLPYLYAVVVNLHRPAHADFVLLTEHGMGILDLKHYAGLIIINHDGSWYAGNKPIVGGAGAPTPPLQVHGYAEKIRNFILPFLFPRSSKSLPQHWEKLQFQTGVVFTHLNASLSTVRQQARQVARPLWVDKFSVLAPQDIVQWAASLRFNLTYGRERHFEPYRLSPAEIEAIVRDLFRATEWKEILPSMPGGEPYAYLKDSSGRTVYKLDQDSISMGRSPDCDIVIPGEFTRVSRRHCKITRHLDRIEVQDLNSKHGTYIDGEKITRSVILTHDQMICLGGKDVIKQKTCALRFVLPGKAKIDTPSTESAILIIPDRKQNTQAEQET